MILGVGCWATRVSPLPRACAVRWADTHVSSGGFDPCSSECIRAICARECFLTQIDTDEHRSRQSAHADEWSVYERDTWSLPKCL
jgi:hypothetical protein